MNERLGPTRAWPARQASPGSASAIIAHGAALPRLALFLFLKIVLSVNARRFPVLRDHVIHVGEELLITLVFLFLCLLHGNTCLCGLLLRLVLRKRRFIKQVWHLCGRFYLTMRRTFR